MLVAFHLMANSPHFALPFRFLDNRVAENEQDTLDDVVNCVEAVLRTVPRQRHMLPDFGLEDMAFFVQPVQTAPIVEACAIWEPRALVLAEEYPDLLDGLIDHVAVSVSGTAVGVA